MWLRVASARKAVSSLGFLARGCKGPALVVALVVACRIPCVSPTLAHDRGTNASLSHHSPPRDRCLAVTSLPNEGPMPRCHIIPHKALCLRRS